MQFLMTSKDMTLESLANRVGERNVDSMLNTNSLSRSVNVGKQFINRANSVSGVVDYQTKINILNTLVSSSDVYEKAALGSEKDWACLSNFGSFSDAMKVPEDVLLPPAIDVLGNDDPISNMIYELCVTSLSDSGTVDPAIFAKDILSGSDSYGVVNKKDTLNTQGRLQGQLFNTYSHTNISPFQNFRIPWGMVLLYSSIAKESIEIPAYPEELSDGYKANYTQMPDMLYQYEPWQIYQSSGPRSVSFSFDLHRDFWTGDHTDGQANKLIRFCEANCFPHYSGSAVNAPLVSMYINGNNFISGVMDSCDVNWYGPILSDGFYAAFKLTFNIVEVSPTKLNYNNVMKKGLIE